MSCGNYTSVCGVCGCNNGSCGCAQQACQPANVIYEATCPDPGTVTRAAHLSVRDAQFCDRRLIPGTGGYLIAAQTPNGWQIFFTTTPSVSLEELQAVAGSVFGNLVVIGSDGVMRKLVGPAVANQVILTNASGQPYFGPIPTATVPDPLTVGTLTVTGLTTLNNVAVSGGMNFTGLGTSAPSFLLGLDASGNLVKGDPATTGVQVAQFFESPTMPSAATPNVNAGAGSNLTIGNLVFDSVGTPGGALFTATNSQVLTCLTAGTYKVEWGGQVTWDSGSSGRPGMILLVNGVPVSNGNSRSATGVTTTERSANLWCSIARRFAAGDTVQVQMGSAGGSNTNAYEVAVNFERTGA